MIPLEEHDGPASPTGEIRHGVRQIARDVGALAELQAELLQVELRAWLRTCAVPVLALGVSAAIIGLASTPILLLALAHALVEYAALSLPAALASAGGAGVAIAAICAALAWRQAKRGGGAFSRFKNELTRNIRWVKSVLSRPADVAEQPLSEPGRLRPR
jgi:hypothetical protein